MNEDTLIKTMPLPHGQTWALFADANVIVLSPCLDEDGREQALNDVQAHWRRSGLRIIHEADDEPNVAAKTQPLASLTRLPARLLAGEG
jgi:hypothetical protein